MPLLKYIAHFRGCLTVSEYDYVYDDEFDLSECDCVNDHICVFFVYECDHNCIYIFMYAHIYTRCHVYTTFIVSFNNWVVTLHIDQSALLGISQSNFVPAGTHSWYPRVIFWLV